MSTGAEVCDSGTVAFGVPVFFGVAGADELKIAAGDLEAGNVAGAADAENLLLERRQRTAAILQ